MHVTFFIHNLLNFFRNVLKYEQIFFLFSSVTYKGHMFPNLNEQKSSQEVANLSGQLYYTLQSRTKGTERQAVLSKNFCSHGLISVDPLKQVFPILLLPCNPAEFQQMSMNRFRIFTDEHVPLKFLITKYIIVNIHRYI